MSYHFVNHFCANQQMYVILLILPICLRFCPGLRVYTVAYTLATLDKIVNKSEKKVKNFFLGNCGKISYIWFMRKNYYIWFLEIMRKISYIFDPWILREKFLHLILGNYEKNFLHPTLGNCEKNFLHLILGRDDSVGGTRADRESKPPKKLTKTKYWRKYWWKC